MREAKSKLRVKIGFIASVCWCLVISSALREHKIFDNLNFRFVKLPSTDTKVKLVPTAAGT